MFRHFKARGQKFFQIADTTFDIKGTATVGTEEMVMVIEVCHLVSDRPRFKFNRNQLPFFYSAAKGSVNSRDTDVLAIVDRSQSFPNLIGRHGARRSGEGLKDLFVFFAGSAHPIYDIQFLFNYQNGK